MLDNLELIQVIHTSTELRSGMNKWDSGFLELYFGFHYDNFLDSWIPHAKISRISESGFPYMGCKT